MQTWLISNGQLTISEATICGIAQTTNVDAAWTGKRQPIVRLVVRLFPLDQSFNDFQHRIAAHTNTTIGDHQNLTVVLRSPCARQDAIDGLENRLHTRLIVVLQFGQLLSNLLIVSRKSHDHLVEGGVHDLQFIWRRS